MIDYGPDNVSTPEDIAETNELESLQAMREEIQEILKTINDYFVLPETAQERSMLHALDKIDRVVNPNK